MTLSNFINGLTILQARYDADGYPMSCEHDVCYMEKTDTALAPQFVTAMKENGWFQSNTTGDIEDDVPYDPEFGWMTYV